MKITATTNGPLIVEGPIVLCDENGNVYARRDAAKCALCRCGGSATKPFCDGAHKQRDFTAPPIGVAVPAATDAGRLAEWNAEGGSMPPPDPSPSSRS